LKASEFRNLVGGQLVLHGFEPDLRFRSGRVTQFRLCSRLWNANGGPDGL